MVSSCFLFLKLIISADFQEKSLLAKTVEFQTKTVWSNLPGNADILLSPPGNFSG